MRRWWLGYLLLGAVLVGCVLALPVGPTRAVAYEVVALASAGGLVAGVLLNRPARKLPWLLMAAGELCSAIGDALYSWYEVVLHTSPYPSLADVFYIAAFPLLCTGVVLLTGRRPLDLAGRIDVGIVTVALALPLWMFLAEPVVNDHANSWLHRGTDLAYPLFDLVLLAMLVRFAAVRGSLNPSTRFLTIGAMVLPVADVAFSAFGNGGEIRVLNSLCWLSAYLCWGAAGLHPSMREATTVEDPARPAGWRRLGLLVAAALVVPAMLALEAGGLPGDHLWAIAASSVAVVMLGVARTRLAVVTAERWIRHSERLRAEVDHRSAHDPLTLLPNRATALELLQQSQERAVRAQRSVGVLVVDVDHLARVNEAHGESVGDDVLRAVARELGRTVRAHDRVGRLGGDEFVVVVEDVQDETALARVAERLTRLDVPVPGRNLNLTCSVGIAVQTPERQVGTAELLHEAVTAAARAKGVGEGRTWFFDDVLRAELTEQAELEAAMQAGIVNGEFELHYQPVVDLTTGRIRSFEALIRWNRPGHGMFRPDLFIPVAERSDLICDIGRWVLAEASRQLAVWRADGTVTENVRVAVNLSGRHLAQATVVADVVDAIASAGLPPQAIVVEVTETVVVDHGLALSNLQSLRDLGIGLSLDDFGTGYTSIEQFRTLPLDTLKIDRSFVSSGSSDAALVGLLVHCAHTFGLKVIAEGVETVEQLQMLRDLKCDAAQGYFFSRPVPAGEVAALVSTPMVLPVVVPVVHVG